MKANGEIRAVFSLASKIAQVFLLMRLTTCHGQGKMVGLRTQDKELFLVATNRPCDPLHQRVMVNLPHARNREDFLKVILVKEKLVANAHIEAGSIMTECPLLLSMST
ncbi:hypothetical protein Sango_1135700 [Sesamum angolense]|uniref:Uncharacterized protein n=1 Tax=Sesamum angolense TaxID=2727404 RepID=A0AAE2BWD9_9LAMI|nr:hypothetical protein Sango_1135700 [Sesamum angolense]